MHTYLPTYLPIYNTVLKFTAKPCRSLVHGDEGCIGPSGKLLWFDKPKKNTKQMHGNIHILDKNLVAFIGVANFLLCNW